jgi:uncharacterized integral membrane protein
LAPSTQTAQEPFSQERHATPLRRVARGVVLVLTLLFVVAALSVSSALVVYTAWLHDLTNGVFALLFAVMSAQIALNWILWQGDDS